MFQRLDFFWWGSFWRGWLQWGPLNMCADKDYSVRGRGWLLGPLQITWWDRPDWRSYRFTPEEAAAVDAQELEEIRQWRASLDSCSRCHGLRGGVRGNENKMADGTLLCDYCSADDLTLSLTADRTTLI
jgi:hypothetical protein